MTTISQTITLFLLAHICIASSTTLRNHTVHRHVSNTVNHTTTPSPTLNSIPNKPHPPKATTIKWRIMAGCILFIMVCTSIIGNMLLSRDMDLYNGYHPLLDEEHLFINNDLYL